MDAQYDEFGNYIGPEMDEEEEDSEEEMDLQEEALYVSSLPCCRFLYSIMSFVSSINNIL